ncbi:MAG: hypothetical protein K8R91_06030 [Phycisphaerae bacterium]|nr:hypothetical protein [Phycisphaerae bacterium]
MGTTCYLVETLLADVEGGILLRRTRLDEIYVLLSLVCVCIAAWGVLRFRASGRAVRKGFVAFTVAWFAGVIALAVIDFKTFKGYTREEHIIEWLSAEMLLVASVLGLVATIRLARRGEPSPMALFLTSGFSLACVRELEWLRPFFGGKIWYSRNLFRPQAYLDPSYFDRFIKSEGLSQKPLPLYPAHLIFSSVMIVVAVIVVIYLVRHRKRFLEQLRELPRTTYGRYFFLGLAGYVGAQAVVGELFEKLLDIDALAAWRSAHGVGHGIATEPVELWSAACLLLSMLMLWSANIAGKNQRRPAADIDCT